MSLRPVRSNMIPHRTVENHFYYFAYFTYVLNYGRLIEWEARRFRGWEAWRL